MTILASSGYASFAVTGVTSGAFTGLTIGTLVGVAGQMANLGTLSNAAGIMKVLFKKWANPGLCCLF